MVVKSVTREGCASRAEPVVRALGSDVGKTVKLRGHVVKSSVGPIGETLIGTRVNCPWVS